MTLILNNKIMLCQLYLFGIGYYIANTFVGA